MYNDYIICYIGNLFLIISSIINLFMLSVIAKIHIKDSFLQQGFFKVVFSIVILEILLRIILIISPFLLLFIPNDETIIRQIIYFSFNFLYITILFFNFITVFYLYIHLDKSENLISKDINDKNAHRDSVRVNIYSFNFFYILSFLFGFIHTGFFAVCEILLKGKYEGMEFFPILLNDNKYRLYEIIIYIPNFIFLIISFLYFKLSLNKEKITENIVITSFAVYCIKMSLFYLNYPIVILIYCVLIDKLQKYKSIIILVSNLCLVIQNYISSKYRINCIYIESIFGGKDISCCQKMIKFFKILFTNERLNRLNSVDYNNSFITFSLSSKKDFMNENENQRNTSIVSQYK